MKQRKYGAKKTTTKEGKKAYMAPYMREYRKDERRMINEYKKLFPNNVRRKS
jgi:hypothetical protein